MVSDYCIKHTIDCHKKIIDALNRHSSYIIIKDVLDDKKSLAIPQTHKENQCFKDALIQTANAQIQALEFALCNTQEVEWANELHEKIHKKTQN